MNSLSKSVQNYLIVANTPDYCSDLYKLCLEKVQSGNLVLIITSNVYDFSNLIVEMNISRDQLTQLIIMNYKKIDEVSHKLLQLHNWSLVPSLVVVDLTQFLTTEVNVSTTSVGIMQKVTLCTVSLLTYLQSISFKLEQSSNKAEPSNAVYGLLVLKTAGHNFGSHHIEMLKNLYFYKTKLYQDFVELKLLLQDHAAG